MSPGKLNEWRVVPRLLVFGYAYLIYDTANWYMALLAPTMTQGAFISTIVGAAALVFNFYVTSGK